VSPDYVATGDSAGLRAFVYGQHTVLEVDGPAAWLSVRDENGVPVPAEKEGRYYRLSRKLANFSVWLNFRAVAFAAAPAPSTASAPAALAVVRRPPAVMPTATGAAAPAASAGAPRAEQRPPVPKPPEDAEALLQLSAAQLAELRQAVKAAGPADSRAINARLDRIEAQLLRAATAIVRVEFDTGSADFRPDERTAAALVPAAKAAERVNVRGRTDARIPGPADPRIALARALAARQFLVDRGVDPAKIKVFALPAGDFVAPGNTPEGRAMNRRVEIELVNKRYAELARRAATLAQAAP
jgi:outer membrane protein OmpA-like peptidoglycan-associated protein